MEKQKAFNLKQANFAYLFVVGSFLCISLGSVFLALLGRDFLDRYLLEATTVLQLIAYVPLIIYAFKSGVDVKSALRVRRPGLKQVILTVLLVLVGYILVTFVGMLWQMFLASLGANVQEPSAMTDVFSKPAWFAVLLLCVYAPCFEEFIFRGVILSGYSSHYGVWKSAIVTGLFFGMLHGFLPSVVPTAFLGVLIAVLVIYTGSIFTGVIYHALHNLLAYTTLMDRYFMDLPWTLKLAPPVDTLPGQISKLLWITCWAIVAAIAAVFIFRALKKGYTPAERKKPEDNKHRVLLAFALVIAIILVVISSITMVVKLPGLQ